MQKFYDCGIDLGTTNSCLAIPDGDHGFEIIDNQADRMSVTPSAVLINGKGRMIIGQRAYNSQKVEDLSIQFKRQIDKILLVGGSTFIPLVRKKLSDEFGVELDSSLNPMTVVAAGAAIYASTSVIDVDDVIESSGFDRAVVSFTYDPISSEESVLQ